jgi:hypothetical protein
MYITFHADCVQTNAPEHPFASNFCPAMIGFNLFESVDRCSIHTYIDFLTLCSVYLFIFRFHKFLTQTREDYG